MISQDNKSSNLFCSDEMLAKYEQERKINYDKSTPLKVEKVSNGIVHPLQLSEVGKIENNEFGGVTDEKLNFIELSLNKRVSPPNFTMNFHDWYKGANLDFEYLDVEYIDEDVVFLGALPKHYGHFILEGLSRLWFCLNFSEDADYKCVYISGSGRDKFNDCFELFGLDEKNIIKITRPTKFRTVIVPEQSIRLHDYYHIKYKETIDRIKRGIKPKDIEKVYFSKVKIKNNRAVGEASIEKVFSENGFSVVYPESLSMHEMIAILRGCKTFAATSATNIHNSIFMDDGSTFACLNRSAHIHPVQTMIERMRHLNGIYIDVFYFSSDKNFGDAPCLLVPTKYLLNFFRSYGFAFSKTKLRLYLIFHYLRFIIAKPENLLYKRIYSMYIKIRSIKRTAVHSLAALLR